ncbi:PAS domain S-box protein [bacterium]|nr:PAS domain S-box protein [bacterium]
MVSQRPCETVGIGRAGHEDVIRTVRKLWHGAVRLLRFRYFEVVVGVLFLNVLVIVGALVFANAEAIQEEVQKEFQQRQENEAARIANLLGRDLDRFKRDLETLLPLLDTKVSRAERMSALTRFYRRWKDDGLQAVGIRTVNGNRLCVPVSEEIACDQPGINRDRIVRLNTGETYGTITYWVHKPGTGSTGAGLPIVLAELDVPVFAEHVLGTLPEESKDRLLLLDDHGRLVFDSEPYRVGAPGPLTTGEPADKEPRQILHERMRRGERGSGVYHHEPSGGENLVGFAPVMSEMVSEQHPLTVMYELHQGSLAPGIRKMYLRHVLAEIPVLGTLVVLILLLMGHLRKSSVELTRRVGEQEEFLASIMQYTEDAIVFLDLEDRVQLWNRAAERMFGYPASDILGRRAMPLFPDEVDPEEEMRQIREDLMERERVENFTTQRMTSEGRRLTVSISRSLVRNPDGEPIGITSVIRDITEKQQMEQKLYQTEKLASLGEMAAGVAHEINNPLGVILGFAELLKDEIGPENPGYEDIETIEQNAEQAQRIVKQLLGFARVGGSSEGRADLNDCIRNALPMLHHRLQSRTIKVQQKLADNLPPVPGDTGEWQQVVVNLVQNALSALEETENPEITISTSHQGMRVRMHVRDNGKGIPKRIQGRIFDPFFTTKGVGRGTGLGLSLTYGIVTKHNGRINFHSVAREDRIAGPTGTTFTVSVPVAETSNEEDAKGSI